MNITVFISYSHEGDLGQRVAELSNWLTKRGINVITDHLHQNCPPEEGWPAWMHHSIEASDVVLVVCTKRYKEFFEKKDVSNKGGYGVTWESALITQELYENRLKNRRIYPILPDDGNPSNIPAILKGWYNGHRFPSGNEKILALIEDAAKGKNNCSISHIKTQTISKQQFLPGEITGSDDPRLLPNENKMFGRKKEIKKVIEFLGNPTQTTLVVTGCAGIGKTEICKAALKQWLKNNNNSKVFWIKVADDADVSRLIAQMGEAIGLSDEIVAKLNGVSQLQQYLPKGLYYLDNLDSIAGYRDGIDFLRSLSLIPGIRILASSRQSLEGVFKNNIPTDPLDIKSATKLFKSCWTGSRLPKIKELEDFLKNQLGCHALAIVLLARLGDTYSWERLKDHWREEGTALARTIIPAGRLDSLDISFSLTQKILSGIEGALELWQFCALFPDGIDEESLELWEQISGYRNARLALIKYYILSFNNARFTLLPPIARYALANKKLYDKSSHGFNWLKTREYAYKYFLKLYLKASEIKSRSKTSEQLWAIEQLLKIETEFGSPDKKCIKQLHNQLYNVYLFNVLAAKSVLQLISHILGDSDPNTLKVLADIEYYLDNVEEARKLYREAKKNYEEIQYKLGIANTIISSGHIEYHLRNIEEARKLYKEAKKIYEEIQDKLGVANTIRSLGHIEYHLDNIEEARKLYREAKKIYEEIQYKLGIADTIKVLGDIEYHLDNIEGARELYREAKKIYEEIQDKLGIADTIGSLGDIEYNLGNIEEARRLYKEAKEIYEEMQDRIANTIKSLNNLE